MSARCNGLRPISVNLGDSERRILLARVAARTVAEGRPVSVSEVVREMIAAHENGMTDVSVPRLSLPQQQAADLAERLFVSAPPDLYYDPE